MATALAILQALIAAAGLIREFLALKQRGDDRAAGRQDVESRENATAVETKNAMDDVPRPSDDAVADSLRRNEF